MLGGTNRTGNITQSLLVRSRKIRSREESADVRPAASGAAATIASDALMNPFDGMEGCSIMWSVWANIQQS